MRRTLFYIAIIGCLFLLISVLPSCNRKPAYPQQIQVALESVMPNYEAEYDSIYIIPRRGCQSCTVTADKIVKHHINDTRSLFIFTDLLSRKVLRIEYGSANINRSNVFVDSEKQFRPQGYEEAAYPVLLIVQADGTLKFNYLLDCMPW